MTEPISADAAVAEVVTLASDLIAIDTTNTDDKSAAGPERKAAEYVAARLSGAGYDVTYVESGAPGRGNVIARLAGTGSARGALLVHGHLDVVPADAAEWSAVSTNGYLSRHSSSGRGCCTGCSAPPEPSEPRSPG
jgi:acetylornithine deacetylase/succinyl-diaminopimelate desuccinylase-like protein